MKRVLPVLFSLLVLPFAGASAQGFDNPSTNDWVVTPIDYGYTTWDSYVTGYRGSGGEVVIPLSYQWFTPSVYNVIGVMNFSWYGEPVVGVFSNYAPVTKVVVPDSYSHPYYDRTFSIGENAFLNSTYLTNVTIGAGWLVSVDRRAFAGCSKLNSIPSNITNIANEAFLNCTGIDEATGETTGFVGEVTIPDSVTAIGGNPFAGCWGVTGFSVDPLNTNYTSFNGVLFNGTMTELVAFPAGASGGYTIPNTVTHIGVSAFRGCSGLGSIVIPNSVTNIGVDAFRDCTALTNVSIGQGVKTIGDEAFYGCASLRSAIIPKSVTYVGWQAFVADQLNSILFEGDAPSWGGYPVAGSIYYFQGTQGWSNSTVKAGVFKPAALPPSVASNGFRVSWHDPRTIPVDVQRATSLAGPWTVVSSNNSTGEFVDANPPSGQAFYRAIRVRY